MEEPFSPEQVRSFLAKVLASPEFRASENRASFLEYVVVETLEGREDNIKGYTIGVDVYGRGTEFDPQADPIVRLEAGRLRRELAHYYLTDGAQDEIRFGIPKGGYVPSIEREDGQTSTTTTQIDHSPGRGGNEGAGDPDQIRASNSARGATALLTRNRLTVFVLLVALLGMGLVWFDITGQQTPGDRGLPQASKGIGPRLYVTPFESISATANEKSLAHGVTVELVGILSQFVEVQVYPVSHAFVKTLAKKTGEAAGDNKHAFVLSGKVQVSGEKLRITANLQNAADGLQIWSERYDDTYTPGKVFVVQDSIATNVSRKLAEPFGLLRKFSRRQIGDRHDPSLSAYKCVLAAYEYRQNFTVDLHLAARTCLERTVVSDPGYARAWALLAYIYADEYRIFHNVRPNARKRAVEAAQSAVKLNPDDVLSYQALSVALFSNGQLSSGLEAAKKAVSLNPYNNEAVAQLGMRTVLAGRLDEGYEIALRAISKSPAPASWYHWAPALYHYVKRDYETARVFAEKSELREFALLEATRAMIYGQLNMKQKAAEALANCRRLDFKFDKRARQWFAVHQISPKVLDHFMEGLVKAGLDNQIPSN